MESSYASSEPVDTNLIKVVFLLGATHTEMSFLGCFGHLMAASVLQQILELVYAPNAVVHMLTGKAITRVVRAHPLDDAALNTLVVLAYAMEVPLFTV